MFKKEKKKKVEKEKKEKKKQDKVIEPEFFLSKANMKGLNYKVYYMSKKEKTLYTLLAIVGGAFVAYSFFGGLAKDRLGNSTILTYILNIFFMVIGAVAGIKVFMPIRTKQLLDKRTRLLRSQFRDLLEALSTSLGAGKNINDSFKSAYIDLSNQYDPGSYILNELEIINVNLANGISIEESLTDFGNRTTVNDIKDFANTFAICYRKGGNIKDMIRNTYEIINDKTNIVEDIETIITGTKTELNMMLVAPLAMVILMKSISTDYAENFATPAGILSSLVAVVFSIAAYLIGKKIVDFKV